MIEVTGTVTDYFLQVQAVANSIIYTSRVGTSQSQPSLVNNFIFSANLETRILNLAWELEICGYPTQFEERELFFNFLVRLK